MIAKYSKEELENMSPTHVVHAFLELQKYVFEEKSKDIEKTSENSNIPSSQENPWKKKPKNSSREVSNKKS